MTSVPDRSSRRIAVLAGAGLSIAALLVAVAIPGALAGWLAAVAFWSSLPIGSLCIVLMMRLIPGAWRQELADPAEAALLLLALAFLGSLPILAGIPALYRWTRMAEGDGFRGIYLTPWFFILRTLVFFAVAGLLAILLLLRRSWSTAVAASGLIAFVILDTTMAVDWLMSLDPEFHSSGFGLYVLSIQTTIALAVILPARLSIGPPAEHVSVLGGLLLTALLLWAYFAFMQYFISWSDNLPASVSWYERRGEGFWSPIEYAIGALGLAPAFLLFFPPVRRGRPWLIGLCLAVLLGKVLETIWLVLPDTGVGTASLCGWALAFIGLGLLTMAALAAARRLVIRPAPRREAVH